jgi:hypothetical protein
MVRKADLKRRFVMRIFSIVSVLALSMLMLACSSVTIKTDYDREYDFSKFKTYRWASGKEINPQDELQKHPLILKRVMEAVDKTLEAKGMTKVEEGTDFDLVVMVHAGTKEKMQVDNMGGYYGGYRGWYDPWWGPYGGTTTVSYYEEATLVVDLVDWEHKELAWRGMATGIVKGDADADEQQERLNNLMTKIFANYPPSGK